MKNLYNSSGVQNTLGVEISKTFSGLIRPFIEEHHSEINPIELEHMLLAEVGYLCSVERILTSIRQRKGNGK
jgi:hypothetical protein